MEPNIIVPLCALVCAVAIFIAHRAPAKDGREPPALRHKIPFVGHLLGFIRYGQRYPAQLSAAHPDIPIFTLDMLVAKFYVINSPDLISSVQRNSRTLSFEFFINLCSNQFLGIKGPGMALLKEKQKGGGGLGMKITHAMNPALLGEGLDRMNEMMITYLKISVDQIGAAADLGQDLVAWCRHAITAAATESAYGKLNPYKDQRLENAFWTVEQNLEKFMTSILPQLTISKVYTAREALVQAFINYYDNGGLDDASALVKTRFTEQYDAGATLADTARLEGGMALGLLSNTVPASFWTLYEICSRPDLLSEIRAEIQERALHVKDGVHTVDLADIRDNCELLVSTFQEVLRYRSRALPMRMVYEDVMLNDRYLLKEGSIVQMPSPTFHRNESLWGSNSDVFNPKRFMKDGERESRRMAGFLAFGMSPSLCPGRHFATGEVLALTAMLLLRYDVIPVRGSWKVSKCAPASAAASFDLPVGEFPVQFKARPEFEGTIWAYAMTAGRGRFGLITG